MNNMAADKNRRVLVIDDNRAIHDDFRKILSPVQATAAALDATEAALFGTPADVVEQILFEVDSAYQGQDGVERAKQALEKGLPYAIAFVDVRMPPGLDGVETTRRLWDLDPDLQIVLCTAYSDYSWGDMFKKLGHRDGLLILKKPFDAVEALQLAHALTEKWSLHRQSRRRMEELEHRVAERTGELQESHNRLRDLIDGLGPSMFVGLMTPQGIMIECNRPALAAAGLRPEDVLGKPFDETYWWTYSPEIQQRLREVIARAAGGEGSRYDVRIRTGEDQFIDIDFSLQPVIDGTGRVVMLVPSASVITERKRAELALQDSEARTRLLVKSSSIGLWDWNLVTDEVFFSAEWKGQLGYTDAELPSRLEEWESRLHPEDREPTLALVKDYLEGRRADYDVEFRMRHKDGSWRWIFTRAQLTRDASGKPIRLMGGHIDVTERRRSENALRESNEKFNQLADNISDTFWIRSPDLSELYYVSPAFERIWGRTVDSLYANPQEWSDFILPEDRERVLAAFAALTTDAPRLDLEYRIVRPDGQIRWVHVRGFQVRDAAQHVVRHIGIVTDVTETRLATEQLRESERRFSGMLRNLELVSVMLDLDARITYCNDFLLRLTGWRLEEVVGRDWYDVFVPPGIIDEVRIVTAHLLADQPDAWHHENEILTRSGARRLIRWNNSVLRSASGEAIGTASIGEDITERKRLETQLFESQKLETVGKLAGGVAHEFNSILTAIIGQSELLLGDLPAGSPLVGNATEISRAAGRAATLTRQLLAYSSKQFLQPESLDLNQVVASMAGMFDHLMGGDVVTHVVPALGLQAVKADAGQIEQVIMNMAINARDAMPSGGQLTLETANVSMDLESVGRYPELKPGDYVMLAISDTGTGMRAEVRDRIFEPFFTTKGVGQGTGLGLSTCYGIVKQSGGHISVYSEPGRGTTFKIYLPQVQQQPKVVVQRPNSPELPRGTETILLVEDDPALREMAATLLRRLGYTVVEAANGIEALSVKRRHDTGPIDLLFTDVVMPHMSGRELADSVRASSPYTKILFTSAYTESAIVQQGVLSKGVALLQKPFTPSALARKIRDVLDESGAPVADAA